MLLVLAGLCLYLPGLFSIPPIDRDEPRFADASRHMLESDDWHAYVVPQYRERPRLNKPPLVYWLQVAALSLTGGGQAAPAGDTSSAPLLLTDDIWIYRLPSVLAAIAAMLLTWRLGRDLFGGSVGLLAALLLGASAVVMFDARQARADQVLLALTTLAQLAMWHVWRRSTAGRPTAYWTIVFWIAVGLGTLTKGPVTPGVVGATLLALCVGTGRWRWLGRLRPLVGIAAVLLVAGAWLGLVAQQVGWATCWRTFLAEVPGRAVMSREGHGGWPGYYLVLLPVLFWPGSLALVPALGRAVRRGLRRSPAGDASRTVRRRRWQPGRPAEFFCLAWLVPSWVVFELLRTKLPHYTMPLYPALALLCARALFAGGGLWRPMLQNVAGRVALWGWLLLGELMALGLPLGLIAFGDWRPEPALVAAVVAALVVVQLLLVLLFGLLRRRRFLHAQVVGLAVAVVSFAVVAQGLLPHLHALWLGSRVAARLAQIDPSSSRPLAIVGDAEDSLVFLAGRPVQELSPAEAQDWLVGTPHGLLIVDGVSTQLPPLTAPLAAVEGFNYSNGAWQRLTIVQLAP
ncbi:MAG: glycosyltransferase family 39 protein [Phycisphaerae bacterium]